MKVNRKKCYTGTLVPNIERGGSAIPLGNNIYWMKGRTHAKGGIDIGKDLEVENNEVMQMLPYETRVFSSIPFLGGYSPAQLVAGGVHPNIVFNAQQLYKKINRIRDDGSRYRVGGRKNESENTIKGSAADGSRDIVYSSAAKRWLWGNKKVPLNLGHRVRLSDGYEYQLNSDGTRTRIGKKPNAYERSITAPMQYTPNNDIGEAIGDLATVPFANADQTYYNGILPFMWPSTYKDAPLYAYRTGDMSYLKNDDKYVRTIDRENNPELPRKLYNFYNQDTIYLPKTLIQNLDTLKKGISMNQENVNRDYIYGKNNQIALDARNHHMQIRQLDNGNYVADFSDVFDVNKKFFDSKANPMVLSQYDVPVMFTGDNTKWNETFVNEINNALNKKYGGKQMNLQNIQHNSLTNFKRTISPNKIGTIVRIDGNGKDKLNYIPSTGSSQQSMKCGGRAKAFVGIKYPFMRYLVDDGTIPERTHITDGADDYPVRQRTYDTNYESNNNNINNYIDLINNVAKDQSDIPGYVSAGVNVLGSVINGLIANNALNKQHAPVRPIPKIAQKLKTKYNINARLSEIKNELAGQVNNITRNTASSHTLRSLYNNLGLASLMATNKLYEDKENKETELINQDIANRQTVDHENVDSYNKWIESVTNFYNNKSLLKAQNWAQMVNGIGTGIGQGIRNYGASKRYRDNLLIAMLPYIKATGVDTP